MSSQAEQFLMQSLSPIAARARQLVINVARVATKLTGASFDEKSYRALSESAAFFAFVDLGGDSAVPEQFPWSERRRELVRAATLRLQRDLRGRHSECGDVMRRLKPRLDRRGIEGDAWTAWKNISDTPVGPTTVNAPNAAFFGASEAPEQEQRLHEKELMGIGEALRAVLTPTEHRVLTERYLEGVTQYEQIDRLIASDVRYQGPGGYARAENYLNVIASRARKKARERLGSEWKAITEGIAV